MRRMNFPATETKYNRRRKYASALLLAFTDAGTVIGHWQRYTDQNRWFFWIVRSVAELEQLKAFVHSMKEDFRQEEMFFEVHATYYEGLR